MAALVLKEAIAALRRTPILSVMTAIVIAVSLAICGMFAMLTKRANDSLEEFRAKLVIEAFFDPSISTEDARESGNEFIRHRFSDITSYEGVSKEEAIAEYVKNSGEDVERMLGYNPLPASVRLRFLVLTSTKAKEIKTRLLGVRGMKEVLYDEKSLIGLEKRSQTLYLLALALGGALLLISLTIVLSTIRLAIEARRDAIHAMQLLGAGRRTIILPYVIEGGFAGFVGGILAGGLILLFHYFVIPSIAAELVLNISEPQHFVFIFCAGAILGIGIGIFGSVLAIWRSSRIR